MNYETLKLHLDGALAVLTINRPEHYNALNGQMGQELLEAVLEVSHDDAVRALMVTGAGKSFCAGGDIKAFIEAGDAIPRYADRLTVDLHGAISKMMRMPKPVLAAVNGPAAGAGFSIAMACDLIVASSDAFFTLAYTKIGASPDGSSTFTLPRVIGVRRAMEMAFTNRVLSPDEAVAWGIVNRVYPAESFAEEALAFAQQLAGGPTAAFGRTKNLYYHSLNETLESQMELESRAIVESARGNDFREGIRAFVEKRAPDFKGQ